MEFRRDWARLNCRSGRGFRRSVERRGQSWCQEGGRRRRRWWRRRVSWRRWSPGWSYGGGQKVRLRIRLKRYLRKMTFLLGFSSNKKFGQFIFGKTLCSPFASHHCKNIVHLFPPTPRPQIKLCLAKNSPQELVSWFEVFLVFFALLIWNFWRMCELKLLLLLFWPFWKEPFIRRHLTREDRILE